MESAKANMIGILHERAKSLRDSGNLGEAYHSAKAAVAAAQESLTTDLDSVDAYVASLELRADVLSDMAQNAEARDDYKEALELFELRPDKFADVARLHASMGAAWDRDGNDELAKEHWLKAIEYFERNDPPLLIDVATISNNLGFLYRHSGDFDHAESQFLRALEIAHAHLGSEHEQTATISSNLGALYQASGHYEQAREMHMMALDSRRTLFGDDHPDTAQSHNNLALALMETGDRSWARRHFDKALATFELLGSEYAHDLETVAENYCEFLRNEGDAQLAEVIAGRVRDISAN